MFTPAPLSAPGKPACELGAHRNETFSSYFDRLPFVEVDAVQLSSGVFDHRSLEIWGRDSVLVRDRLTPLAAFTMVPEPDWVMFLWPHAWSGDFRVDGRLSGQRDVFFLDAEREWFTAGAVRDTLSLGVRRSVLAEACASQKGVDFVDLAPGSHVFENSPALGALLQRIYSGLLRSADVIGPIGGRLFMAPACEADMISALAAVLDTRPNEEAKALGRDRGPLRVIRAAQTILREAGTAAVSVSDLCRSAGVGRTRLHQCFADVYGISAGHYLKRHRLSRARERFLDRDAPPSSVKEVALTLGFCTSGRFSREYRDMFGELPSDSLVRTAGGH